MIRRIRWTCNTFPGTHTTWEAFGGWVSLGHHFPGCGSWSIEGAIRGRLFVDFKWFDGLGRMKSGLTMVTFRTPGPMLTIGQPIADRWRTVRVLA